LAAELLEKSGHSQVKVIDGGLITWINENPLSVNVKDPQMKEFRHNIELIVNGTNRPTPGDIKDTMESLAIEKLTEMNEYPKELRDMDLSDGTLLEALSNDAPKKIILFTR